MWQKTEKMQDMLVTVESIRAFMPDGEGGDNDISIPVKVTLPCRQEVRIVADPDHGTEVQERWIPIREATEQERDTAYSVALEYIRQNGGELVSDVVQEKPVLTEEKMASLRKMYGDNIPRYILKQFEGVSSR